MWAAIPAHFPHVDIDVFVVMPNHVHGVLALNSGPVEAQHAAPLRSGFTNRPVTSGSLSAIVRSFKSATAKAINDLRNSRGSPVWQRNYYERIIRSEPELYRIREYIANNPVLWDYDRENPNRNVDAEYEKVWSWIEEGAAPQLT
jgi:REP element-mobilizing transposase RayT